MKNKKGFTLVELLACMVILAILMAIVFPFVLNNYNEARQSAYEAQIAYVEVAAQRFAYENQHDIMELSTLNMPYTVTIQELYEKDYVDLPINNPISNSDINPSTSKVVITRTSDDKWTCEVTFSN